MNDENILTNNEISIDDLKTYMKEHSISIKELAEYAKQISEEIEQQEKEIQNVTVKNRVSNDSVIRHVSSKKPIFDVAMSKYPDFAIQKETPKSVQILAFMPSIDRYFIKTKKGNNQWELKPLNAETYVEFTSGMPEIQLHANGEHTWVSKLKSGKRFYQSTLGFANYPDITRKPIVNCLKHKAIVKDEHDEWWKGSKTRFALRDYEIEELSETITVLGKDFDKLYEKNRVAELIEASPNLVPSINKHYGKNNTVDFMKEFELSNVLVKANRYYSTTPFYSRNTHDVTWDTNNCKDFKQIKNYLLYSSTQQGYSKDIAGFINTWNDVLNMQLNIYGKIKDKYPDNIASLHQRLVDKTEDLKYEIDEQKMKERVNELINNEMQIEDWIFIVPKSQQDFFDEAQEQANCLFQAGYIQKFIDKNDEIYFMRKKSDPEHSYITIERCNNQIVQQYRARNERVSEKEAAIIQKWNAKCIEKSLKNNIDIDNTEELRTYDIEIQ